MRAAAADTTGPPYEPWLQASLPAPRGPIFACVCSLVNGDEGSQSLWHKLGFHSTCLAHPANMAVLVTVVVADGRRRDCPALAPINQTHRGQRHYAAARCLLMPAPPGDGLRSLQLLIYERHAQAATREDSISDGAATSVARHAMTTSNRCWYSCACRHAGFEAASGGGAAHSSQALTWTWHSKGGYCGV